MDATLIGADSNKAGAAGNYKGAYGFPPLTAWCSNVGDSLAVMLRPGNAGSFTASDHVLVLDAAMAQIPAGHRADVLVTIDGAGARTRILKIPPGWAWADVVAAWDRLQALHPA